VLISILGSVLPSKAAKNQASRLADQIIALEKKLVDATPDLVDMRDPAVSSPVCKILPSAPS
jgi:hypothetical protein